MEQTKKEGLGSGQRFDEGKPRHDLIDPFALNELAKVYEMGARKYAPNNWRKGMKWSRVIASHDRHWNSFKNGEDFDLESKLYHLSHVIWNATTLLAYYKIYPEGDDRPHSYLSQKRIGLDIDDVLANWIEPFSKLVDIETPKMWNFGYTDYVNKLLEDGFDYKEFMLNLPVKTNPDDIPFEPACYVTNRTHTEPSVAEEWISKNGFPKARVIQTADKISAAKEMKLDIFVDDKFDTFVAMNNAGIMCYLFDAPHNQRYNVGHRRLYSLKDLR